MGRTEAIFQAIADVNRRQIINMLANRSMNVNAIAGQFDITRQAVSLHIQCLLDCGLITVTRQGRERVCQANLENLDVVADWVSQSKRIWLERFRSLERFLESTDAGKVTNTRQRSSKNKRKKHAYRSTNEVKKRH